MLNLLTILRNVALVLGVLAIVANRLHSGEISVAVASNFGNTIRALVAEYQASSEDEIKLILGSTGKLYAQILHGAPFDVFLAADEQRPKLLEEESITISDTRFTYAIGRLVLWSKRSDLVDSKGSVLEAGDFRFLSIAHPKLAPYGQAAKEVLMKMDLWEALAPKLVFGENVGQAFHFISSGNAELGLIAHSQILQPGSLTEGGSRWLVPSNLHSPIEQQAVQLSEKPESRRFLAFLKNEPALKIIREYGYDTP